MAQRTDWVDYAKGIGIILVVYAHLLSSGYRAGLPVDTHFFFLSDSIVYSFHMPLFFFLAGLFVAHSYASRGMRQFLISKIRLIAYPYLVWSLLQIGIELLFSQHSQRGVDLYDLMAIPYLPWSQFWFLYALLLMYIVYGALQSFGRLSGTVMLLIAGVLFVFPVNSDIMALNGFSTGFVFFVVGAFSRTRLVDLEGFSIPAWVTLFLLPVLVGSGYYIFENMISPTRLINGSHPLYFLYLSTVGITFCVGLAQLLAKINFLNAVKSLGTYSLQVYLVHMLAGVAVRIILINFFDVRNPYIHIVLGTGAGLIVPILIYRVTMKVNFPYLFKPGRDSGIAGNI